MDSIDPFANTFRMQQAPYASRRVTSYNVNGSNGSSVFFLLFGLVVWVGLVFLFTWFAQMLYNGSLRTAVPGLRKIGYWQMLGIWVFIAILASGIVFPSSLMRRACS